MIQLHEDDTQTIIGQAEHSLNFRYAKQQRWHQQAVYNHIETILIALCASESLQAPELDKRLQAALHFIQQHYRENWTIDTLAKHCHLSPSRFQTLFRQALGISPILWRSQLRIQEACRLLATTSQPIGHIATELGFRDQMHFSRRFRELVGENPRQYRALQRC